MNRGELDVPAVRSGDRPVHPDTGLVYLIREILIPVSLAVFFTFLLSPMVTALQRRGLHRGHAVVVMVLAAS